MARYTNTPKTSLKGINAELVKIQDAFEDVLDRKGDGANFLDTDLDMNSQRILNLPEPVYSQEPVRLGDVKPFIDDTKTARDAAVEAAGGAQESEEQAAVSAGQSASSAEQSATSAANSAAKAKDLTEITSALLISQGLSGEYGFFEKGFTYNESGDVGIDSDGSIWTYNGALPFEVEKDTVPSEPVYSKYNLSKNYTRRVKNIDELKALEVDESMVGIRIKTNEYHAGTGYGGGEWEIVTGEAADDIDVIQSEENASIQFKIISVSKLDLSQLGVRYGGVEYERSAIREFLTKGNVKNYVISGELLLKQGLGQPAGTRVEFEKGGKVRITSPFYAVWAFEGGDELTELVDPVIDGDNFLGCNGIGVGGSGLGTVTNIKITRPVLLRCKRQPDHTDIYNGGGRGIMVESNVTDVQIDNPQAIDCTAAYAYQCTVASPSDRVTVVNPIARNCMHYAEFFDLADFSNDPDSGEMGGINILGGYAYNCGKGEEDYYSGDGVFDAAQDMLLGEGSKYTMKTLTEKLVQHGEGRVSILISKVHL